MQMCGWKKEKIAKLELAFAMPVPRLSEGN
jgi:hypothetical protein